MDPDDLRPRIPDGTSAEDLAIFLADWQRYIDWALREDPARYDTRLQLLLGRLEGFLESLMRYQGMPGALFAEESQAESAQFRLFLAFSAAIDATKWLAGQGRLRGRPRSFADAFDLLVRAGMLPVEKRRVYIGLARLRNWITHEAVSLPPAKVHALLRFYLPELEAYAHNLRTAHQERVRPEIRRGLEAAGAGHGGHLFDQAFGDMRSIGGRGFGG